MINATPGPLARFLNPSSCAPSGYVRSRVLRPTIGSTVLALTLWALAGGASVARATDLVIQNETIEVRFDTELECVRLRTPGATRPFAHDIRLSQRGGHAEAGSIHNGTFGTGKAITVEYVDGSRDTVAIYPKLPFVLFQARKQNTGTAPALFQHIDALSATLDLTYPADGLKTLGTGGLLAPDKNPGSYAWLAVVEPRSRRGVVGGWLTFNRGSGVVFSTIEEGAVRVRARLDEGRLRVNPGATEALETFALGYFDDARLGLEAWADAVAQVYAIHLPAQPVGYCTWYSRPHGGASDEKHLAEQAAFAATNLAPFGFSVVQIDDGWQAGISTNGPKRNFSAHAPKGPYPAGMKAIAGQISALGLVPGIWFMPFAGTYYDPFFQAHPDWFVKRADGQPYETAWGGTSLDMTNPDAQAYLRENAWRIAHEWGFRYFKMDGLWTGTATKQIYVNSGYHDDGIGDAVFRNPEKTNLEAYRDGLKTAREGAGEKVFILGCCSPQNMRSYGGAFGLVDAMRIGPDNGSKWDDLISGPTFGSRQYFLHGRVWYNDPDPIYTRASMPLEQARLICSWVTLSGQLNLSSEWFPGLPPERLDLLKRTMPSHGLRPRPADLFDEPLPRVWLLTDTRRTPRRDVVGLFNWADQEAGFDYPLDRLGLAEDVEYVAFDYWANAPLPPFRGRLVMQVPPRSCAVLAVRPRADHPQLISTSRHITQGIVDALDEKWNGANRTLSGREKIVANDPCELRVVASGAGGPWTVAGVELSRADQSAGVKASYREADGLLRVTIDSPSSREVKWQIRFRAADTVGLAR